MDVIEQIIDAEKYIPITYLDYKLTSWGRMLSDINNKESYTSNYAATIKLLANIDEGERSAREKGWLSADDVEAILGL